MSDRDLDDLLAGWRAPSVPHSVERRIMQHQKPAWIRWLWQGHVQVPVPAVVLTICTVVFLLALAVRTSVVNDRQIGRSEGLQPVKHLKVRIVRSNHENNN